MSGKKSDPRRDEFCLRYALLGSIEEAAVQSGFDRETALREGIACLKTKVCRDKISELRELLSDGSSVVSGLRRLAFGSCKDAVILAFSQELPPSEVIGGLDLFNVSEIKRDRNGGVEIRLFDRLKALEKLYELENALSDSGKVSGLMKALLDPAMEEGDEENDRQQTVP